MIPAPSSLSFPPSSMSSSSSKDTSNIDSTLKSLGVVVYDKLTSTQLEFIYALASRNIVLAQTCLKQNPKLVDLRFGTELNRHNYEPASVFFGECSPMQMVCFFGHADMAALLIDSDSTILSNPETATQFLAQVVQYAPDQPGDQLVELLLKCAVSPESSILTTMASLGKRAMMGKFLDTYCTVDVAIKAALFETPSLHCVPFPLISLIMSYASVPSPSFDEVVCDGHPTRFVTAIIATVKTLPSCSIYQFSSSPGHGQRDHIKLDSVNVIPTVKRIATIQFVMRRLREKEGNTTDFLTLIGSEREEIEPRLPRGFLENLEFDSPGQLAKQLVDPNYFLPKLIPDDQDDLLLKMLRNIQL